VGRESNRRRLDKLLSRQRGSASSRGPGLPDTPEFVAATNRFIQDACEEYREAKESGLSRGELDAWQPSHTPQGRANINAMLTEIRLASKPPAEAEADRREMEEAEERRSQREECSEL
jgi:hypothetical protein